MILSTIAIVVVLALVVAGLLAPMESLSWWATGGREEMRALPAAARRLATPPDATSPPGTSHYLVYLSGIGVPSGDALPPKEVPAVADLRERLGDTTVITDVYPYSVENRGLTGDRPAAWVWRRLWRLKEARRAGAIAFLINIRNAFQVFVSADRRYGPVYNLGVAHSIWESLIRHGYRPHERRPVAILGWSGGAQVAIGAAWYLSAMGVPVHILSMAGLFAADPGLDRVQHLWHLHGSRDHVTTVATLVCPGRWRLARRSPWNRARRDGRVTTADIGPLRHMGAMDYFADGPALPDGRSPRATCIDAIVAVLVDAGLAERSRIDEAPERDER